MRKKKKRKKIPHDRQAQIRFPEKRPTEKKLPVFHTLHTKQKKTLKMEKNKRWQQLKRKSLDLAVNKFR